MQKFAYKSRISQHQCKSFAMSFKAFVYTARILQNQCKSFAPFSKYFVWECKKIVKTGIILKEQQNKHFWYNVF